MTTGIIILVAGIGLASWQTFNQQQTLDAAVQDLENNLRQVRGWAMSVRKVACEKRSAGYEVDFSVDNGYRVREKCEEDISGAWQNFFYPAGVVDDYSGNFIFAPLTGATNLTDDSVTITLKLEGRNNKAILVRKNGEIEIKSTSVGSPTPTAIPTLSPIITSGPLPTAFPTPTPYCPPWCDEDKDCAGCGEGSSCVNSNTCSHPF